MKAFIAQFLVFLAIASALFFIVLVSIWMVLARCPSKFDGKHHLVVIGDSRSQCAIDTRILDETVNLSAGGETLMYSYLKLKRVLENNDQIDRVILSVSPHTFYQPIHEWYFGKSFIIEKFVRYFYLFEKEDLSTLFRGNKSAVVTAVLEIPRIHWKHALKCVLRGGKTQSLGGFLPLSKQAKFDTNTLNEAIAEYDNRLEGSYSDLQQLYLMKIVTLCQQRKINIEILTLPMHPRAEINPHVELNNILSNVEGITIHRYETVQLEEDAFADLIHVNASGAQKMTILLKEDGVVK